MGQNEKDLLSPYSIEAVFSRCPIYREELLCKKCGFKYKYPDPKSNKMAYWCSRSAGIFGNGPRYKLDLKKLPKHCPLYDKVTSIKKKGIVYKKSNFLVIKRREYEYLEITRKNIKEARLMWPELSFEIGQVLVFDGGIKNGTLLSQKEFIERKIKRYIENNPAGNELDFTEVGNCGQIYDSDVEEAKHEHYKKFIRSPFYHDRIKIKD